MPLLYSFRRIINNAYIPITLLSRLSLLYLNFIEDSISFTTRDVNLSKLLVLKVSGLKSLLQLSCSLSKGCKTALKLFKKFARVPAVLDNA